MTWWDTPEWKAYEAAQGVTVSRAEELVGATWQTRVVDLSVSEAELWKGVRKSYRSLIRRAEKNWRIEIGQWGDDLPMENAAALVRSLHVAHRYVSGRETRSMETWILMAGWLESHRALVSVAWDRYFLLDGYAYILTHGAWAYYGSGVTLRDNLSHALIWRAMLECKARGVRWFELGWMDRDGDTEKDRGIALFKRGFGGFDMPAKDAPMLAGQQSLGDERDREPRSWAQ